jgi:ABC-type glycerol-3-phosphate transport system permease component
MTLFYISIPLMLVGIAIAVVPLLWTMAHSQRTAATVVALRVADEYPTRADTRAYESIVA